MDVVYFMLVKVISFLFLYFPVINVAESDFGLCGDHFCTVPVSKGTTLMRYTSDNEYKMSFEPSQEVIIYVKEYGPKRDLWGVMMQGHKGYVPKQFIREIHTNIKDKDLVDAHLDFRNLQPSSSFSATSAQMHILAPDHILHDMNSIHGSSVVQSTPDNFINSQVSSQNVMNAQNFINSPSTGPENAMPSGGQNGFYSDFPSSLPNNGLNERVEFSQSRSTVLSSNIPQDPSHFNAEGISPSPFMQNVEQSIVYQQNNMFSSSYSAGVDVNNRIRNMEHEMNTNIQFNMMPSSHISQSGSFNNLQGNVNPTHFSDQQFQSQSVSQEHAFQSMQFPGQQFQSQSVSQEHAFQSMQFPDQQFQSHPVSQEHAFQSMQFPGQQFQSPHVSQEQAFDLPPTSQHHAFSPHSGHVENTQPLNDLRYTDQDLSKTLAMLQDRGITDQDMFANSYSTNTDSVSQPSQNWNLGQHSSQIMHQNTFSSQSEHPVNEDHVFPETSVNLQSSISSVRESSSEASVQYLTPLNKLDYVENTAVSHESVSAVKKSIYDEIDDEDIEEESDDEKDISNSVDSFSGTSHNDPSSLKNSEWSGGSSPNVYSSKFTMSANSEENKDFDEKFKTSHSSLPSDSSLLQEEQFKTESMIEVSHTETSSVPTVQAEAKDFLDIDVDVDVTNDKVENHRIQLDQNINVTAVDSSYSDNYDILSGGEINSSEEMRTHVENMENENLLNSYQKRNLKGEEVKGDQSTDPEERLDDNTTQPEFDAYNSFENGLKALRSFVEAIMMWIPEPLYSMILDLERKGIPHRVPVFTAVCSVPCIVLIITVIFIKERSKENRLSAQLMVAEKNVYTLNGEKIALEEKLENLDVEVASLKFSLAEEKKHTEELKTELDDHRKFLEVAKSDLQSSLDEIDDLKEKEHEYFSLLQESDKEKAELIEQNDSMCMKIKEQENSIEELNNQLQENKNELSKIEKEKSEYLQCKEDFEEKLAQLQQNCNQLLSEAEVWNVRVNELSICLSEERSSREELEKAVKLKDEEIEALKLLVETFKTYDEIEDDEQFNDKDEKLQMLKDSSTVLIKLQKQEEENKLLTEKLSLEKNKVLDMEVEILDAKSEIDKLKINYNQALQDKAEAQTKLEVLTNYFKDKEIQLQKQLGAQEAVRQKKEEDANSAERRICLIEQENASYKYQVASMKQEMEETERTLKSQIAVQEKKAHESWIAARAAERKLEDMKQEITQLRQRLTLLEREQENWVNSSRDDIIRPIPKRVPGLNDDSSCSQDVNSSLDMRHGIFPPPLHERMPPPPMLPPDRPLPPLPPPPIPPFLSHLEPHFRHQPWHIPPDSGTGPEFRTTPPEFHRGRESTPPRGRQSAVIDGDMGPHASSPLGTDNKDSRNSSSPRTLPDFHDIPPLPPMFFPPPGHHSRFPLPPPFRRELPQSSKRSDNQGEFSMNRGIQQTNVPEERWQHPNTRV